MKKTRKFWIFEWTYDSEPEKEVVVNEDGISRIVRSNTIELKAPEELKDNSWLLELIAELEDAGVFWEKDCITISKECDKRINIPYNPWPNNLTFWENNKWKEPWNIPPYSNFTYCDASSK